ncbi:hypothetical protein AAZX31_13G018600 [Glycine max]
MMFSMLQVFQNVRNDLCFFNFVKLYPLTCCPLHDGNIKGCKLQETAQEILVYLCFHIWRKTTKAYVCAISNMPLKQDRQQHKYS